MNHRTRRRTWIVTGFTVACILACVGVAAAVGVRWWWLVAWAFSGLVIGISVGGLIPLLIEDGEQHETERRRHGYRRGRARRDQHI
jgi:MFS family permease